MTTSPRREPFGEPGRRQSAVSVRRSDGTFAGDAVATEEPLEIRLVGTDFPERSVSITMRTPGADSVLAVGFLHGEGIVRGPADVAGVRRAATPAGLRGNAVTVELAPGVAFDPETLARHFPTTSSCGVCGKASIESLRTAGFAPIEGDHRFALGPLLELPDRLREAQAVFDATGGIHAAGAFDASGAPFGVEEDVGRHNAVDKLVGRALLEGRLPAREAVLVVSGRASFELVQKALAAGFPVMVAVGAPSSLAVELARDFGLTLAGFVRGGRGNVYTHPERIFGFPEGASSDPAPASRGR